MSKKSKTYSIKSKTSNPPLLNYKINSNKLKYFSIKPKINLTNKYNSMEKITKNGKSNSKTDNSQFTKETKKLRPWTYKLTQKIFNLKKTKPQWSIIVPSLPNFKKVLLKNKKSTIKFKLKDTISQLKSKDLKSLLSNKSIKSSSIKFPINNSRSKTNWNKKNISHNIVVYKQSTMKNRLCSQINLKLNTKSSFKLTKKITTWISKYSN